MSFFKDLGGLYTGHQTGRENSLQQLKTFPGHVMEVCMDSNSPLYESTRDIGKIKFRDLVNEYNRSEDLVVKVAYPLDRSIARYPYPGEEVIIYRAFGETTSPLTRTMVNIYFYSFVVSALHNPSFNAHPFIGTDKYHIDKTNPFISYDTAKKRFDKRIKEIGSVKENGDKIKVYKQLKPYEGDFILQGRFGNSIRFGSTSQKEDNAWKQSGLNGDGIMILRVDRDSTTNEKDMLVAEDINKDDTSMYFCTAQKVELELACSPALKTWIYNFDVPDKGSKEMEKLLNRDSDTSGLWQKAVETNKPVTEAYQTPKNDGVPLEPTPTTPAPNTTTQQ